MFAKVLTAATVGSTMESGVSTVCYYGNCQMLNTFQLFDILTGLTGT